MNRARRAALAAAAVVSTTVLTAGVGAAHATTPRVLDTGPIQITFADTNAEEITDIHWSPDGGQTVYNGYVGNGGTGCHGDATEFWGESYDNNQGADIDLVVSGFDGTWSTDGPDVTIAGADDAADCAQSPATAVPIDTNYKSDGEEPNEIQVTRTFHFPDTALSKTDPIRAYVPRLNLSNFPTVIYPSTDGGLETSATTGTPTEVTDWDATKDWFADNNDFDNGVLVIRDPSVNDLTAHLQTDNDSTSNSNNSDLYLDPPASGWKGDQTETEYLCFYNADTWTTAARDALELPDGCANRFPATTSVTLTPSQNASCGSLCSGDTVTLHAVVSGGSTTPTGTVTFSASSNAGTPHLDCGNGSATVALTNGTADCVAPVFARYSPYSNVRANYNGDTGFKSSLSDAAEFSVSKAPAFPYPIHPTGTAVYGHEQAAALVAKWADKIPNGGTLAFRHGSTVVCSTTVLRASTQCRPAPHRMLPGLYSLTVTYSGNPDYESNIATVGSKLTITKDPTKTTLTLHPKGTATKAVVHVTPRYAAPVTGKVHVHSGHASCVVHLHHGGGHCTLAHLSAQRAKAVYPGGRVFQKSSAVAKLH